MDGELFSGVVGLLLGFLPAAIITLAVVVLIGVVALFLTFLWLLEQPLYAWLYVISLSFNVVILAPLWMVSWFASNNSPDLWGATENFVFLFSGGMIVPTVIFYLLWQRALKEEY